MRCHFPYHIKYCWLNAAIQHLNKVATQLEQPKVIGKKRRKTGANLARKYSYPVNN